MSTMMSAHLPYPTLAVLLGTSLLLGACAQQENDAAAPPVGVPAEATASAAATTKGGGETPQLLPTAQASADPLGAMSLPDMRTCLRKCTDDSRMRGVGAEQIEADCREQCGKSCTSQCEQASEPQKTRCKQDCERQSETTKLP